MLLKYFLFMMSVLWKSKLLEFFLPSKLAADIRYYCWFCLAKFGYFSMGVICLGIQINYFYVPLILLFNYL